MKTIDCYGEICPIPIMKITKHYHELKEGEQLAALTDHICVIEKLEDFLTDTVSTMQVEEIELGAWQIVITK